MQHSLFLSLTRFLRFNVERYESHKTLFTQNKLQTKPFMYNSWTVAAKHRLLRNTTKVQVRFSIAQLTTLRPKTWFKFTNIMKNQHDVFTKTAANLIKLYHFLCFSQLCLRQCSVHVVHSYLL